MCKQWNLRKALTVGVAALLAACGGGGGGSGPPPVAPSIDITALNRDSVAHAAAASILVLSPTGAIPLGVSALGAAGRRWAPRLALGQHQPVNPWGSRERTLAMMGPFVTPCPIGGTLSETDDDRDANGVPSAGDVITLVFSSCQNTPGESLDGSMTLTLTQLSAGSIDARIVLVKVAAVTPNHSMTLDGSILFNLTPSSASMTTDGNMSAEVVIAHLGYTDLITLQSGCLVKDNYQSALALTQTSVSGYLHSRNAGGIIEVTTRASAPLTKLDADAYPSAGTVQARGKNSTLLATALSAAAVRLDLDADGNGSFEASESVSWDWLL
jgi:hypothetical protein